MPAEGRAEFIAGLRDLTPLLIGVTPFGVLFGIVAVTAGLSFPLAAAMSFFVFAGASQFAAVALLTQGAAYPLIVLTVFIVNLRHAFYGASLSQYIRDLPRIWRRILAFATTDESYAVTIAHYRDEGQGDAASKHWYYLGTNLGLFSTWQLSTWAGYLVGQLIGDPLALGLDFTLPLTFIALLVPRLKSRATLASALVAAVAAIAAFSLPNKLGLLFAIVAGIAAGFGIEKWVTQN
jgi:4-azaleucine resistance transporter AzlC